MTIQILGPGCPNCNRLEENARAALDQLGLNADVEKITDSDRFAEMGLLMTPGLAVDGEVKSSGKVLSAEEIASILKS